MNDLTPFIAGDGVFSIRDDGFIKLVDLKTNSTRNLVSTKDIRDVRDAIIANCLASHFSYIYRKRDCL